MHEMHSLTLSAHKIIQFRLKLISRLKVYIFVDISIGDWSREKNQLFHSNLQAIELENAFSWGKNHV